MKMVDMACLDDECGEIHVDVLLRADEEEPRCRKCGSKLKRAMVGHAAYVIQDSIPGGIMIRNGICNEDGSPRRYDSHSEMRLEAKRRNMLNRVEHQPGKGGDRNPHTQRFV